MAARAADSPRSACSRQWRWRSLVMTPLLSPLLTTVDATSSTSALMRGSNPARDLAER